MIRLFMKLDLMEQNGHGIPIILKEYGKEVFEIEDNFITVTIPFDKTGFENKNCTQNCTQKNKEEIIIEIIEQNNKITRNEMATALGVSLRTIQNIINKSNKIVYIGSSKNGHWEIKE